MNTKNKSGQNRANHKKLKKLASPLRGVYTALITPFDDGGKIDFGTFKNQVERQIRGGVAGIVPTGTTGESPTLNFKEHIAVIKAAVEFSRGRVPVIAGTGANSTAEAVALTKAAEKVGADASLQVAPYYNKPSPAGLYAHFAAVARATSLPIILYNIPSRCGVEIPLNIIRQLAGDFQNIVGLKEAGGGAAADRISELAGKLGNFSILSGDDSLTLPFMAVGATGVVSVVSNLFPKAVVRMVKGADWGNSSIANGIHRTLFPLTKEIFREGNPVGIKCAMRLAVFDTGVLRLPLVRVTAETEAVIRCAIFEANENLSRLSLV